MTATPLLNHAEFKSLLSLADQRGQSSDENSRIYDAIDQLLAGAWHRCIGVERYMLLRLNDSRSEPCEIQALRFEGWGCTSTPFFSIAGPKPTPTGGLGRKMYSRSLRGKTHIERRMLDGTWCSLGVVLPGVVA